MCDHYGQWPDNVNAASALVRVILDSGLAYSRKVQVEHVRRGGD